MKQLVFIIVVGFFGIAQAAVSFSPARVTKISMVVVQPGQAAESRFGHAALRLSFENQLGSRDQFISYGGKHTPEQLKNFFSKAFHAVGITSKFPSLIENYSYSDFKKMYADEARGITSYPLNLQPTEKRKIIEFLNQELKQRHASRPFQIFTFNCAVMAVESLNAGLRNPLPLGHGFNRPLALPRLLAARGLVDRGFYESAIAK